VIGLFGTTQAAQQMGMSYSFIFLAILTLSGFVYLKRHIIETRGKTLEQIEKEVLC
jgi:molybdenum-dependent DNA-binding transcriptional regulator ModE